MSYKNIYFILVRPQLGENIGATARALKNFKLSKLRIVNPRSGWPNQKAIATSVGAKNILQSSKIYNSLDKSIGDLDQVFATTARIRNVNKKIISIFDLNIISNELRYENYSNFWQSTKKWKDISFDEICI